MQTQLIRQLSIFGFHIVVFVVSVASAGVTAAERSAFWDTFLLYLSCQSLAVVSILKQNAVVSRPFPVVSVVGDRIISISDNTLYLSY